MGIPGINADFEGEKMKAYWAAYIILMAVASKFQPTPEQPGYPYFMKVRQGKCILMAGLSQHLACQARVLALQMHSAALVTKTPMRALMPCTPHTSKLLPQHVQPTLKLMLTGMVTLAFTNLMANIQAFQKTLRTLRSLANGTCTMGQTKSPTPSLVMYCLQCLLRTRCQICGGRR